MGVDYSASLFIGIPADQAIDEVTEQSTVIRYDEVTGKPYHKTLKTTYTTLFGKKVEDVEDAIANLGLEYEHFNSYVQDPDRYIGKTVGSTRSNRSGAEERFYLLEHMAKLHEEVEGILKAAGYNGQVSVILGLHIS